MVRANEDRAKATGASLGEERLETLGHRRRETYVRTPGCLGSVRMTEVILHVDHDQRGGARIDQSLERHGHAASPR